MPEVDGLPIIASIFAPIGFGFLSLVVHQSTLPIGFYRLVMLIKELSDC